MRHSFQPQSHDYRWTRDHPLEQVRGNPTMPVQTRRQLATDPEMCMFALTVSIVEPKNIKEAMAILHGSKAMQDELHQIEQLKVWKYRQTHFEDEYTAQVVMEEQEGRRSRLRVRMIQISPEISLPLSEMALYGLKQAPRARTADHAGDALITSEKGTSGEKVLWFLSDTEQHLNFIDESKFISGLVSECNPMIQPEPEDLPKDNPKLEIAVLRKKPFPHNLKAETGVIHMAVKITSRLLTLKTDIKDPVIQCKQALLSPFEVAISPEPPSTKTKMHNRSRAKRSIKISLGHMSITNTMLNIISSAVGDVARLQYESNLDKLDIEFGPGWNMAIHFHRIRRIQLSIQYSVFIQLINTAYSLLLNTAYRSSGTETEILVFLFDFRDRRSKPSMVETMAAAYTSIDPRTDYGLGVARPKIDNKDSFKLKEQFLKELRENTFSGSDNEDANEHIEKVLEIVDLFHVPNITVDQLMLRVFLISLTEAACRWLRNEPTGSIKIWEDLKTKF
ncbi:hypothetical protein Tco_0670559 [Tanacetum coccineum]